MGNWPDLAEYQMNELSSFCLISISILVEKQITSSSGRKSSVPMLPMRMKLQTNLTLTLGIIIQYNKLMIKNMIGKLLNA